MSVKMVSRFFAAALVALSMTAPLAIAQETQKPNIVLMVMDNLGLGLTRFRGHLTIWEKGVHDAKKETALCG